MYRTNLGPSEFFEREKFIFVYQDVRGRFMSDGDFVTIRPQKPVKSGPKDVDESTDTYDNRRLAGEARPPAIAARWGFGGISQPGFYATAGMIDAHPAVVAVSPQAPVTDYYMGDDVYHNGAFMLAHRFSFYMGIPQSRWAIPLRLRPPNRSTSARPTATTSICDSARWPMPMRSFSSTSSRCGT
ncbi:MAG: CocE/NonD family hydrolase [Ignavibacteriota bacterium]